MNNSVLSLFVSMLCKLYRENRERVARWWTLATLSYCLRAVQVWNHLWREGIFSLYLWFLLLPSPSHCHERSWHENTFHACLRSRWITWRASWPCRCLLLKRQVWGGWLPADDASVQHRKEHRAKGRVSCSLLWWADCSYYRVCNSRQFVQDWGYWRNHEEPVWV